MHSKVVIVNKNNSYFTVYFVDLCSSFSKVFIVNKFLVQHQSRSMFILAHLCIATKACSSIYPCLWGQKLSPCRPWPTYSTYFYVKWMHSKVVIVNKIVSYFTVCFIDLRSSFCKVFIVNKFLVQHQSRPMFIMAHLCIATRECPSVYPCYKLALLLYKWRHPTASMFLSH